MKVASACEGLKIMPEYAKKRLTIGVISQKQKRVKNILEREMKILNQLTTPLQIFWKLTINFDVNFKSIKDPDDIQYEKIFVKEIC